ncbi:MAG: glycosyltransferase family 9 protein [Lautropia sp.]|nr:glycosyltransferase family 9 protein [Lautropia sp.]
MSLPTLWHLHQRGYQLELVGKGWASALLAGTHWRVHQLPNGLRARVNLLRRLRQKARSQDPGFNQRLNTLLLTNSFSSALEARLAGLKSIGYRQDGRGWLLRHAHPQPTDMVHESERFWLLAHPLAPIRNERPFSAQHQSPPEALPACPVPRLPLSLEAQQNALSRLAQHRLASMADPSARPPFVCLVPFATGTLKGASKAWPGFPELCRRLSRHLPVVILPGPGAESSHARLNYPDAISLENASLDVYAAVMARASLVIANDTGPGHLAAAVGAPLISILGPTDSRRYGARGPNVSLLQHDPWPQENTIWHAAADALRPLKLSVPLTSQIP